MIKAMARIGERRLLILGLDQKNIEMLQDKKPIHFNGGTVGLDDQMDVVILYGRTLDEIAKELRDTGFDVPETPTASN
jgi:hypothetical protein